MLTNEATRVLHRIFYEGATSPADWLLEELLNDVRAGERTRNPAHITKILAEAYQALGAKPENTKLVEAGRAWLCGDHPIQALHVAGCFGENKRSKSGN